MTIHSPRIRRLVTVFGVVAALLLGLGSIRAAAAWTAASAPLTVAPVSVTTLQDRLAVEQARSVDLRLQLQTLNTQSTELTAALEAAQAQINLDTDHATQLAKDLKAAKQKLAKLEASIAKARQAARRPTVVVTTTRTVASSSSRHEDDDEDEDEDHGGDDD
jgi:chromosome segregation ATPase